MGPVEKFFTEEGMYDFLYHYHIHYKGNALIFMLEAVDTGEALLSVIKHGEIVSIDNTRCDHKIW